jgi:hypothetical protein
MPVGDGTGPYGTFINFIDTATGLMRSLYRYWFCGYSYGLGNEEVDDRNTSFPNKAYR